MNNLKKVSLAILIIIIAVLAYFIFAEADVEEETYKLDKPAASEVAQES
ncbi:hypothetical protein [Acinetobacter sp. ANC 4558]|nr:hypothetical protein [Acinetobacter sp. ANC 4558]